MPSQTEMGRWLQPSLPPMLPLADLDRSRDGALDLRQHPFSGRFVSAKLEAAYATHTHVMWRPRLRCVVFFTLLWEIYALISGLHCRCGARVGVYEGWALVYSYAFTMSMLILMFLLLSPGCTRVLAPVMPLLIPAFGLLIAVGYIVPLEIYADHNPHDHVAAMATANNESLLVEASAEKVSLAHDAAWFSATVVLFNLLVSTFGVSFGVGPIPLALFSPVPLIVFMIYESKRLVYVYDIESSQLPKVGIFPAQTILIYSLCTVLTFFHASNNRQQYIVRIFVQHELDLRVQQLEQEKERLDYERQFALQMLQTSTQCGHSDGGWTSDDINGVGDQRDESHQHARPVQSAPCCDHGGSPSNKGGRRHFRNLNIASSSGISEPELASVYSSAALPGSAPLSPPGAQSRVSCGCASRASQLMPSHYQPTSSRPGHSDLHAPSPGHARQHSYPFDETTSQTHGSVTPAVSKLVEETSHWWDARRSSRV